ncbi:MAG: hypothetical protein AAFX81_10495 [Pseudomonadota bacterium]
MFGSARTTPRLMVVIVTMFMVAACQSTGSFGTPAQPLTPEEQRIRSEARLFNETVFGGAVTKAAVYGGVAALATLLLTGDPGRAAQAALVGVVAGGAVGALDGYMVATQQEAANRQVREIEVHIANVQQDNQRLEQSIQTTQRVIASTEARLAAAESQAVNDRAAVASLQAERARAADNVETIDELISGASTRRDQHIAVAQNMRERGIDTAVLDQQIAESTQKLQRLSEERDLLTSRIGSGPIG